MLEYSIRQDAVSTLRRALLKLRTLAMICRPQGYPAIFDFVSNAELWKFTSRKNPGLNRGFYV
jgi:hypothetical protein